MCRQCEGLINYVGEAKLLTQDKMLSATEQEVPVLAGKTRALSFLAGGPKL
jgi:hypothetical protein